MFLDGIAVSAPTGGLLVLEPVIGVLGEVTTPGVTVPMPGPGGAVGPVGPQGIQGVPGADGPVGPQGETGAVGPQGFQGVKGDTGLQGPIGETGPAGAQGIQGEAGPIGPQGTVGAAGPAGPQGGPGPAGADGQPGATGPAGADGAVGPQGIPGEPGPAGADGGQGVKGDTGATGPAGTDGPIGPQGTTGPVGAKGDPGTAATVTVGTVTTGAAGTQAQVTNSGTTSAAVLNFVIPKGADGTGGSGAVSSVAGRTGAVVITTTDLADFTEASQDVLGAILADSTDLDYTYNDAANTETATVTGLRGKSLPASAALTAGLSIRVNTAGTAWEAYTPGGGSSGTPRLSAETPSGTVAARVAARTGAGSTWGGNYYQRLTPTADIRVVGLEDSRPHGTGVVTAKIWNVSTGTLIASSAPLTAAQRTGTYRWVFANGQGVVLTAGAAIAIGIDAATGTLEYQGEGNLTSMAGFTVGPGAYAASGGFPNSSYAGTPTFDVLTAPATLAAKGVIGPLDPVDFPTVSNLTSLPNNSGALYTGVTPPRPVYRAADGTLYYGPAYSATP
ncbi:hypothetical protein ACI3L1_06775 [Deinococcus sp. SM5_A1]|uniref:hypothetical protein n=1 Tax=Deinococcus sp. SM5_A1 TaxID=3379094 RepID=UPI00385C87CF